MNGKYTTPSSENVTVQKHLGTVPLNSKTFKAQVDVSVGKQLDSIVRSAK